MRSQDERSQNRFFNGRTPNSTSRLIVWIDCRQPKAIRIRSSLIICVFAADRKQKHPYSNTDSIVNYCLLSFIYPLMICFQGFIFTQNILIFFSSSRDFFVIFRFIFVTSFIEPSSIFNLQSIYPSFIHIPSFYLGNQYHILIFIFAFF